MATLLLMFTILFPTVHSVPQIYQETIIVDPAGTGDFITIQDAIDNANPLSIIEIRPGVYRENNLRITKKLALVGENPDDTIIDLNGGDGFILVSSYVEIHNLKIINSSEYAISVPWDSDHCNISHCVIEQAQAHGIVLQASFTVMYNVELSAEGSNGEGIKIRGQENVINGCTVSGFKNGILILLGANDNQILYTNTFDNDVGIDIRINSRENVITHCNIYGNNHGAYVWQNSNNNRIYLNNFWKNDVDAIDDSNNTWDNNGEGNYWDDYTGVDTNGDGIGDTPYTVSSGNMDRCPLMTMILPDTITAPANINLATNTWDDTPSFTWVAAVYNKGVQGYYVKIDTDDETYVGDTTSWTSPVTVTNGVHTFYVRAQGIDETTSNYATLTFSIDTTFVDTDGDGWSDDEEQTYNTDPNNPDNYPLDTDGNHIPDSVDTDDDADGYSDDMELSYGTSTINSNAYPTDTDRDGIPDENSPDGKYTGDVDDDDDGIIDTTENKLGSDPRNVLDVTKIYISGNPYYLVDVSGSGIYDILYELASDTTTGVEKQDDTYLIDVNGDGLWDYVYQTTDSSVSTYMGEQPTLTLVSWILVILAVVITVSLLVFYYFRKKPGVYVPFRKPIKLARRPSIKKPLPIRPADTKDTVEMIGRTQTLLQHIQQDVQVYMEQLSQMEDQLITTTMATEEPIFTEEETTEPEIVEDGKKQEVDTSVSGDVESQVDAILARLEDKDKD